jgi:3-hydroxybutyryl-CoA dehydrogenase
MTDAPKRLGVIGAGTMGAGIAQLGVLAGMDTLLHDPIEDALDHGVAQLEQNLKKGAERGRWSSDDAAAAAERLRPVRSVRELGDRELIIEAAPEKLDLKRELFEKLSDECDPGTVLATNTSSIPVTQLASASSEPENVVGMHFFNPAPLMKLVEVIAALQTGEHALEVARAAGEAMGKTVIDAVDGPGFLVNRCGRPFGSEGLRILQERLAGIEQIDEIYRDGGYRMGPFELMDLVGIDVGYAVAQSFTELSFGEPRWKPNPLQAKMVAAGRLGRKTDGGWYDYSEGEKQPSTSSEHFGRVASISDSEAAALFDRVQCCIVNEAVFALGEGVGSAADIDTGTKLGLNWPKGPLELGKELGFDHVLETMDRLYDRYHEERYRAAPLLRDGVTLD